MKTILTCFLFLLTVLSVYSQKIEFKGTIVYANGDSMTNVKIKFRPLKAKIRFTAPGKQYSQRIKIGNIFSVYNDSVRFIQNKLGGNTPFLAEKIQSGNVNIYKAGRRYFINKGNLDVFEFRRWQIKRFSYLLFPDNSIQASMADTTRNIDVFTDAVRLHNSNTFDSAKSLFDETYFYKPKYLLKLSVVVPDVSLEIKLADPLTFQTSFGWWGFNVADSAENNLHFTGQAGFKSYYNQKKRERKLHPTYNFSGRYFMLNYEYHLNTADTESQAILLYHGWQISNFSNWISDFAIGAGSGLTDGNFYFGFILRSAFSFNNKRFKR